MTNVMKKRAIIFVHQSGQLYGSDRVLLEVVRHILDQNALAPIVLLPEKGPLVEALNALGVDVRIGSVGKIKSSMLSVTGLLSLPISILASLINIRRLVKEQEVALIYSNSLAVLGGCVAAAVFRLPHVWHIHEIVSRPRSASRLFPRLTAWSGDKIISVSSQVTAWLESESPRASNAVETIWNGLPDSYSSGFDRGLERRAFGYSDEDIVIALLGRVSRRKGQQLLIDAMIRLSSRGRLGSAKFLIVGDVAEGYETQFERMEDQLSLTGLRDRVTFAPFIPLSQRVWAASDIAVMPSLEPESFGLVAIEAMAFGLPVIASAHGGALDIVVEEQTGLLFRPGDAESLARSLERLIHSAEDRVRLGQAGALRQRQLFSQCVQMSRIERVLTLLS